MTATYKDIFITVDPVVVGGLRRVPNPVYIPFGEAVWNCVRIDILSFGAVGLYNTDVTFLSLAADEVENAMRWVSWRTPGGTVQRSKLPLGIFPTQHTSLDGADTRICYPYNPSSTHGQAFVSIPRLDGLTLNLLNSNAELDTRTMYYWCLLRFTQINPQDQLSNPTFGGGVRS